MPILTPMINLGNISLITFRLLTAFMVYSQAATHSASDEESATIRLLLTRPSNRTYCQHENETACTDSVSSIRSPIAVAIPLDDDHLWIDVSITLVFDAMIYCTS